MSRSTYVLTFVSGDVRECTYDQAAETFTHVLNRGFVVKKSDERIAKISVPDCCKRALDTGDWNEGPGGVLCCPECHEEVAKFKQ